LTEATAGRVGRAHGRDGSFYVNDAARELAEGMTVVVGGSERRIERRAGTDARPIVRLAGIGDRDAVAALLGESLLVDAADDPVGEDEWRVDELVGLRIDGIGEVVRVIPGPSCDVLEVGPDAVLVPLVRDAVRRVDPAAGVIEVDRDFLGL
jgi:16S rRNA processing protein RimM